MPLYASVKNSFVKREESEIAEDDSTTKSINDLNLNQISTS
jgi:hypothetical protein